MMTTSVPGEEVSAFVQFPLPPAKAVGALVDAGVIRETSGRKRDRVFAYAKYPRFSEAERNCKPSPGPIDRPQKC